MEIAGQPLASRVLGAVLRREGAARQLLFWGPPGVGKREAARKLAWGLIDPGAEHGPESQSLDFRWVTASGENLRLEEIDPVAKRYLDLSATYVDKLEALAKAYRKANLGYLTLGDNEVLERVIADPRLLRLPLVRYGNVLTIGVDEEAWKVWHQAG